MKLLTTLSLMFIMIHPSLAGENKVKKLEGEIRLLKKQNSELKMLLADKKKKIRPSSFAKIFSKKDKMIIYITDEGKLRILGKEIPQNELSNEMKLLRNRDFPMVHVFSSKTSFDKYAKDVEKIMNELGVGDLIIEHIK